MSKVNYFGDTYVDAEDLNFTEYAKSDETRDVMRASIHAPGVAIVDKNDTYLKAQYAGGYIVINPGYAIDALGRTVYLPQDRAASGSTPGAPGYHPAWPDNKVVASQAKNCYVCISYAEQAGETEADDDGDAHYTRYYKSYSITIESSIDGMNTVTNAKIPLAKVYYNLDTDQYTVIDVRPMLRFYSEGLDLDSHQKVEHCNGLINSTGIPYAAGDNSLGTLINHGPTDKLDINQITSGDYLYLDGQKLIGVCDIEWDPGDSLASGSYNIYFEGSGSINHTTDAMDFTSTDKYYIASLGFTGWDHISSPNQIFWLTDQRRYYGIRDDMVRNTSAVSGSTVKDALDNMGTSLGLDAFYLRRDGTNDMEGDLDVGSNMVKNVTDILGDGGLNISPGGTGLYIDNDIDVSSGDIVLDNNRTVDTIDISESLKSSYDYVVEVSSQDRRGTVSLDTALNNVSTGGSIFIKEGTYNYSGQNFSPSSTVRITGESLGVIITLTTGALTLDSSSKLENVTLDFTTGKLLLSGNECIVNNCRIGGTSGTNLQVSGDNCSIVGVRGYNTNKANVSMEGTSKMSDVNVGNLTIQTSSRHELININCEDLTVSSNYNKLSNFYCSDDVVVGGDKNEIGNIECSLLTVNGDYNNFVNGICTTLTITGLYNHCSGFEASSITLNGGDDNSISNFKCGNISFVNSETNYFSNIKGSDISIDLNSHKNKFVNIEGVNLFIHSVGCGFSNCRFTTLITLNATATENAFSNCGAHTVNHNCVVTGDHKTTFVGCNALFYNAGTAGGESAACTGGAGWPGGGGT